MAPLSVITVAAIGGGASKFVEKAWDAGEKWLLTYFKDHGEKAQEKAIENSMKYLSELAQRIKKLEENKEISQEKIANAQDHPDFSILLQKSLLTAAQTDDEEKYKILAAVISERLINKPESTYSLASKLACDAIAFISGTQIKLLALANNLFSIRPHPFPPKEITLEFYQQWMNKWLQGRLMPYLNLEFKYIDLKHLEALSCIKINPFLGRDLNQLWSAGDYKFSINNFEPQNLKIKIEELWVSGMLEKIDLTTVGEIIGVFASDIASNTKTQFLWE